eukprot:scaffold7094_cov508-Pinguiococcus_pyrenoidosus.AAC.1
MDGPDDPAVPNNNIDDRSFPQLYNVHFIGHINNDPNSVSSDDQEPAVVRLREGTGGWFGNIVVANIGTAGVLHGDCGQEVFTQDLAVATASANNGDRNFLYWSSQNVVYTAGSGALQHDQSDTSCSTGASKPAFASLDLDPMLVLQDMTPSQDTVFTDPRPVPDGTLFNDVETPPADGFFDAVDYKGGFSADENWLVGLSWLDENARTPDNVGGILTGEDITTDTTWFNDRPILLTDQVFVRNEATLTIEQGTTILAYADNGAGLAPSLIVEQGATLMALGTAAAPITFTSAVSAKNLPQRGLWGGLIVLGRAPLGSGPTTRTIEGLSAPDGTYGGTTPDDSSGVIQYVRVWYGGAVIGQDNEINGITFGGVGSGTTVDHIDVAFNLDDGVEFFGGTVNVKYLSVIFVGDDAIDTDQGYSGSMQFVYVMLAADSNHGAEMDSIEDANQLAPDARSFPTVYNAHFVGHLQNAVGSVSSDDDTPAVLRLREGTGGVFGNMIVTNVGSAGVFQNDCGSETFTQDISDVTSQDFLFFSGNNIVSTGTGNGQQFVRQDACASKTPFSALNIDPQLVMLVGNPSESTPFIDPRPQRGGNAFNDVDSPPPGNGFIESTSFKGAFSDSDLWLSGLSWIDDNQQIPDNISGQTACGNIISDSTWSADEPILLTCQVFVKNGATLTIEEGATIFAYKDDGTDSGSAPSLIIERGAELIAVGSQFSPITFTSALPQRHLPQRGVWGGLIINGRAPVDGFTTANSLRVEGLTSTFYGGTDAFDDSGILSYVRVWYGGSVIGADNEINGITFAGVGSGTSVDHIEVAFNLDDGIEFFGGTVNVKFMSVLFCGDDGIDTDKGYQGLLQFAFVMLGEGSQHGAEMDGPVGSDDTEPPAPFRRSFPSLYNALFLGDRNNDPNSVSADDQLEAVIRLREGTGGRFGNMLVLNYANQGIFQNLCGSETRGAGADPTAAGPDYLFISPNTLFNGAAGSVSVFESTGCSTAFGTDYGASGDPELILVPTSSDQDLPFFDPRPIPGGAATQNVDSFPDPFFTNVNYRGAFGDDLWLEGWSWLAENGRIPRSLPSTTVASGVISSSTTWSGTVLMTQQVFVPADVTLTIQPGTTIYAYARTYGAPNA